VHGTQATQAPCEMRTCALLRRRKQIKPQHTISKNPPPAIPPMATVESTGSSAMNGGGGGCGTLGASGGGAAGEGGGFWGVEGEGGGGDTLSSMYTMRSVNPTGSWLNVEVITLVDVRMLVCCTPSSDQSDSSSLHRYMDGPRPVFRGSDATA
jgi:hypothetical protein